MNQETLENKTRREYELALYKLCKKTVRQILKGKGYHARIVMYPGEEEDKE